MGHISFAKTAGMLTVTCSLLFSVAYASTPIEINSDDVNFRESASTSANVLGVFNKGDKVNLEIKEGDWSKIEYNGIVGYVSSQYVGTQTSSYKYGIGLLKVGSKGASVSAVQARLKELKYFNGEVSGYYGHITKDAVAAFQAKNGLEADGVVGFAVREKLDSAGAVKAVEDKLKIEKIKWSDMKNVIPRGANFTIVDVNTGKRFTVKRRGGTNHIDYEPLTSKDTAILKNIYGGSWSWNRRPAVVIYEGKAYAASINGMPHGGGEISSNGFNGHACVHFYQSRTHGSGRVDSGHQSAVVVAANLGEITKTEER